MEGLFTVLTQAIEANPAAALVSAFVWGLLSVLLSPCHLASIPLAIAFLSGQEGVTIRQAFRLSLVFACGILLSLAAVGAVTAGLGRIMGDLGFQANWVVAAVLAAAGLHLLGVLPVPGRTPSVSIGFGGHLAALTLGFVLGSALGPCTFAFMAPVLAVCLGLSAKSIPYTAALLGAFAIGHCSVIVLAGSSANWVQGYLSSKNARRATEALRKPSGLLLLLAAAYLVYTTM
ncbi:MAG: cytochrome c biogenesis CcdA family protein [Armatimonadota bacterium]